MTDYDFRDGAGLLALCEAEQIPISEAMLRRETGRLGHARETVLGEMNRSREIMRDSAHRALTERLRTMGGLIGGEAKSILDSLGTKSACGALMGRAVAYAMGVLEVNSSMGLIVAAPTAGSSGVLPGALFAVQEEYGFSDEAVTAALFNAGAVGYLITRNATVAGAEGGCQAEVGAASAMAASAVAELFGVPPRGCLDAASTAIANLMGLVCDPIGGLVEAPCQKRNAVGVANALVCAQLSVAGIGHLVPFDETVAAMYAVGKSLPFELRESALGGLAATPTACQRCGGCPGR